MISSGLAQPASVTPDTPFSLGSQSGDLMHMLLRTLARGRDSAIASGPGEALGAAAPSLGRTSAPMPTTDPPHPSASGARQPAPRPTGFAALHKRAPAGRHTGTGGGRF